MYLKDFEFTRRKDGIYSLLCLSDDNYPQLSANLTNAIGFLEDHLGTRFTSTKNEFPEDLCVSLKYSRLLEDFILTKVYCSQPPPIPVIASKNDSHSNINLTQLREKLFTLINTEFQGYIPLQKKTDLLPQILKSLKLASSTLETPKSRLANLQDGSNHSDTSVMVAKAEAFLFQDHHHYHVLQRNAGTTGNSKNKITTTWLIEEFNHYLLKSFIKGADFLQITFVKPITGKDYRRIHFVVSRLGLYCEFSHATLDHKVIADAPQVQLLIEKPKEIVSANSQANKNIYRVFMYLWKNWGTKMIQTPLVVTEYRKKMVQCDISSLLSHKDVEKMKAEEPTFDSEVERDFYSKLLGYGGFFSNIQRDAEILLAKDPIQKRSHVMIPDFQLQYHNHSIFIEVVGFWTAQYKTRKLTKLGLFPDDMHQKLLLVVDERINFPKTPFPTFYYNQKHFPISAIVEYITHWEEPLYLPYKKQILPELHAKIFPLITKHPIIRYEDLAKLLSVENSLELKQILDDEWETFEWHSEVLRLNSEVLISRSKITAMNEALTQLFEKAHQKAIPKRQILLSLDLGANKTCIDDVLRYCGYKTSYRNLLEPKVYHP